MHILTYFFQWMDEEEIRQVMEQEILDSLLFQEDEYKRLDEDEEQSRLAEEAFHQFLEEERMYKQLEQQQEPHLDNFLLSFEENVATYEDGWNSDKERELTKLEAQLDAERLASFDPYDDGYDSNNSQTWDHPEYN